MSIIRIDNNIINDSNDMSFAKANYILKSGTTGYSLSIFEASSCEYREKEVVYPNTGNLIGNNIKISCDGGHTVSCEALNGYYLYYYKPTGNTGSPPFVESIGVNGKKTVDYVGDAGYNADFIASKSPITAEMG